MKKLTTVLLLVLPTILPSLLFSQTPETSAEDFFSSSEKLFALIEKSVVHIEDRQPVSEAPLTQKLIYGTDIYSFIWFSDTTLGRDSLYQITGINSSGLRDQYVVLFNNSRDRLATLQEMSEIGITAQFESFYWDSSLAMYRLLGKASINNVVFHQRSDNETTPPLEWITRFLESNYGVSFSDSHVKIFHHPRTPHVLIRNQNRVFVGLWNPGDTEYGFTIYTGAHSESRIKDRGRGISPGSVHLAMISIDIDASRSVCGENGFSVFNLWDSESNTLRISHIGETPPQ